LAISLSVWNKSQSKAKASENGKSAQSPSLMASSFETPREGAAPQDEVLEPHGEEHGSAVRLEP
jgi:hypothetical protein